MKKTTPSKTTITLLRSNLENCRKSVVNGAAGVPESETDYKNISKVLEDFVRRNRALKVGSKGSASQNKTEKRLRKFQYHR